METKKRINGDIFLLPIMLPITLAADVFIITPLFGLSTLIEALKR
jgi:hypothetical protein